MDAIMSISNLLVSCLLVSAAAEAATPRATQVKANLMIPGTGSPISQASIFISDADGTILYAGTTAGAQPSLYNISQTFNFPVVMPGLWDAHTHYGGDGCPQIHPKNENVNYAADSMAAGYAPRVFTKFGCALQMLRETVCAGITSVRELGGVYGQAFRPLVESNLFPSPHIYYANKFIGMTGGHADQQYVPVSVVRRDYNDNWEWFGAVCDGPAECVKKVREQLRAQSDVIKIMTTGGVLSAFDQPTAQQFSFEEVRAMVEEATRAGRAVASHAHGADGIAVAIEAGVHTIEHGSYMNTSLAAAMKKNNMIYVPTIAIQQSFNQSTKPDYYDDDQWAKGQEILKHHADGVRTAIAAGVVIAAGTDCPGDSCARVGDEINYLNSLFGITPLKAIEAATYIAPLTLGPRAPKSGLLAKGYVGDLIALNRSPLDDLTVLKRPNEITHVFKKGILIKSPTNGVCNPI